MSRLIRFISARWTRRGGRGRATTLTPGGADGGRGEVAGGRDVSSVTTTHSDGRLCCRVSLLDGTDMIVDLPVSQSQSVMTAVPHRYR